MNEPVPAPEVEGPQAAAAARPLPAGGHPVPPVFHPWAFLLGLLGVVGAVVLVPIAHAYFADRLGLAAPVAAGFTGLSAAAFAAALGAVAGARCRRLAFYELFAVSLLWSAFTAGLVILGAARAPGFLAGLAAQGPLVYALAVGGVGHLATIAALVGASLSFLLTGTGTGRADLSFSYEWYVARSHLRLSPKMLAVLFGVVVVGVAPGVLFVVVWSLVREVEERRAYRRGELIRSPRLPATLLMTLFSMAAVALGVWTLVVVLSVMSGFSQDLKSKILGHTAHGMVLSYGQDDFGDWREVRKKTLSVPGVTGATPFTYSEVMASSGQNLTGAIVKGIDEASVGSVIDLPKSIQSGKLEWLAHPEQIPRPERPDHDAEKPAAANGKPLPGVLLGRQLALGLRAQVGDVVDVLSPFGDLGPTGPQPKSRPFRVAGIFYSGMYEYDSKFAYVDLAEAQRFFGLSSVTGLEVKVKDVDAARATMDKVVFALGQWPYYAKDWGDLNRSLFAALQQEKVVMAVILGFMVLVTTFTIIATLIMMVLEKRREIAVLKSMGAGVAAIMRVFVIEGLVLGGVGVLFGLVLGLGTCLLIDKVGIPLNPEIYYIHNLPVVLDAGQIAGVVVAALVFSFLATLYPASKAARLHPVDGLRSE